MSWVLFSLCLLLVVTVYTQAYGQCGVPGSPDHGHARLVLQRPAGIMVEYSCEPGYHREGPLYGVCLKGVWTSSLPACLKTRSGPGSRSDGTVQDPGVLRSLEELPSTQRTPGSRRTFKSRQMRKKKKKRKRKEKRIYPMIVGGNDASSSPDLDMSCLLSSLQEAPKFVRPPQVPNSVGPKFVRRKTETQKYLVAIYRCSAGYKLHNPGSRSLGCQKGKWVGRLPICLPRRAKISCINAGCEHDCKEVGGKPKCFCFRGFRQSGKSCIDIDECSRDHGGCESTCHNTAGSFYCDCRPGYRLATDHSSCVDINECVSRNGHGPCQGQCTNLEGSYQCSCEGTPGTRLADDGVSCADIDECRDPLYCSHGCVNTRGSAFCLCPLGYMLGPDWRTCQDINECAAETTNCSHSCDNTPGSFSCSCPSGFTLNSDGTSCWDKDECREFPDLCSHTCENTVGSYQCLCPPGHQLSTDHRTCHAQEDQCQMRNCSQDCVVENDRASCVCDKGYVLEDDVSCVDVDECEETIVGCSHDCVNEEGSYHCSCPEDLILLSDRKTCGVKECEASICTKDCFNSSDPSCACREGYMKVGSNCEDVDECSTNSNSCSQLCRNTKGSYECFCRDGFSISEDKKTCVDLDECEQNMCSENLCVNVEGSYLCECPSGYTNTNGTQDCEDINECDFTVDEGSNVCSHICVNSLGSFHCECPSGLVLAKDSRTCEDIDECFENNEIDKRCSHDCFNVIGSYHCECPQGYVLNEDKHLCSEERGCGVDNGGCSHICIVDGGYPICECPEHFILANDSVTCLESKCSEKNGGCSQICDDNYGLCSCYKGYTLDKDSNLCTDKNECLENNGNCSQVCLNTDGSHYCECELGYRIDPKLQECVDVDECAMNVTSCNQVCVNIEGSFRCECHQGYVLSDDGSLCLDVNECLEMTNCSQVCVNTEGSFRCGCQQGFTVSSDLVSCDDINECSQNISNCSQLCNNYDGGFFCGCNFGFKLVNETYCVEVIKEECEHDYDEGKGKCCCRPGHVLMNTTKCVRVEACIADSSCDISAAGLNACLSQEPQDTTIGAATFSPTEAAREEGCELFPVDKSTATVNCGSEERWRYPEGTECEVTCAIGYQPVGPGLTVCLQDGSWSGQYTYCKAQVRPYIRCPPALRQNLPLGYNRMAVKLPQPKSNVDWEKYVTSVPSWGKQLQTSLPFGTTTVQFTAISPSSSYVAKCTVTIHVKDTEKPKITPCPDNIKVIQRPEEKTTMVMWQEPTISDNVHVAHVFQSQRPGVVLKRGVHIINYIVADSSGNIATCQFTITVTGANELANEP